MKVGEQDYCDICRMCGIEEAVDPYNAHAWKRAWVLCDTCAAGVLRMVCNDGLEAAETMMEELEAPVDGPYNEPT